MTGQRVDDPTTHPGFVHRPGSCWGCGMVEGAPCRRTGEIPDPVEDDEAPSYNDGIAR